MLTDSLTLVEAFELKVPLETFRPLVTACMKRLEVEGVAGLVSMQFHTGAAPGQIGAIIRFADRRDCQKHVDMISGWSEFKEFASAIRLVEIRVFGELDPSLEAWMRQFEGPINTYERLVAGFDRRG